MTRKVRICLSDLPKDTPEDASFFLAGTPNQWQPDHGDFCFCRDEGQVPFLELDVNGPIEFLITRGSWETEEAEANDRKKRARIMHPNDGPEIHLEIPKWRDLVPQLHTVCGEMVIEKIKLPGFVDKRNLRILLPHDYHAQDRRYPVLYMTDGQNLFDEYTSHCGEWQIDEHLEALFQDGRCHGVIVVGIDNAGHGRMEEYAPWPFEYGGQIYRNGGAAFARALIDTVKPFIDRRFRTLPDQKNTAIAGSSLGGLISLYAGMRYQKIFGAVAALSPSIAITRTKGAMKALIRKEGRIRGQRLYLDMGTEEDYRGEIRQTRCIARYLQHKPHAQDCVLFRRIQGAGHSEAAWAARFPEILEFLFPQHIKPV